MAYQGLREWVDQVDGLGQLQRVSGAHWDLEIGAITELVCEHNRVKPAILFDDVPGYPHGHRVLSNLPESVERMALITGLPPDLSPRDFIQTWRRKIRHIAPIEANVVRDGPALENVREGKEINLWEFPTPRWHEHDGGRYIGSAHLVVTRDPDEGWINAGIYRVMIHDEGTLGLYMSPGKHGRIHRDKYFARGEPMPVAMSFGHDPLLFLTGATEVPYGMSEYDYAGGIKGEPLKVINGPCTGLPIPADAEIAIEGEVYPEDRRVERPFGEWTGYYASASRQEPTVRVKTLMYRTNPILCGSPPFRPAWGQGLSRSLWRSALVWNALEDAGVPDVVAVNAHPAAGRFLYIVAIKQRYAGHARQAGFVASQTRPGAYLGRYVIVVDEDIDVYNTDDVIWALCTRSDPDADIDIIRRAWSGPLDPIIPPERKGFNSRAIIDATRPFEWKDRFPVVSGVGAETRKRVEEKWRDLIFGRQAGRYHTDDLLRAEAATA